MVDKTSRGRFVWHDLVTAEPEAAHGFYSSVFGWKRQPWDQDPAYVMFAAASGPIGGTMAAGADDVPHWIPYLGSADIDATLSQARDLGATVVKDLTETGSGGRYAVLADPQGAHFGVYGSDADPGQDIAPRHGEVHWHELATTDAAAAVDFYMTLFGWEKSGEFDMGPMGIYYLFGRNGRQLGGIFNKPEQKPGGSAWLGYTRVKDIHRAVKKVGSSGGRLINGPMEVPGGDWVAMFEDPHGASFAAVVLKEDMQPSKPVAAPKAAIKAEVASKVVAPRKPASGKSPARKPVRKAASKTVSKTAGKKAGQTASKTASKRRGVAAKAGKRPSRKVVRVAGRKKAAVKRKAAVRKSPRKQTSKRASKARKGK
ncbi:MAG TPA: VOC family protein [Steroidobacteraceae bacterium]|jgi:hypothetical protein